MLSPPRQTMQPRHLIAGLLSLFQALARLTSTELKANFGALRTPLLMLAAAAVLGLVTLALLLVALILLLGDAIGNTAATAIVALAVGVAAALVGMAGLSRLGQVSLTPRRSIATFEAQIDRLTGLHKSDGDATRDAHDD